MTSTKVDANSYYITDLETYNSGKVARISSDAVAKPVFLYGASELFTTNTIRNCTQIPVPFCERVVRGTANRWLVQQYIPGRTVCSLWPVLGWWKRFRIVLTLRYYVHLLRAFSAPQSIPLFPGPLSIDGKPQICNGRLFTETGPGPFTNYCELSKWYQNRLIFMRNIFKTGFDVGPFDDSLPLVFTHLDLHPLNLILGDDGQLWVIDWQTAGWYPSWFESASMQLFARRKARYISGLRDWEDWIPFIAGPCDRPGQLPFIKAIEYTLENLRPNIPLMVRLS